jgi:hypothetical protein
LAGRSRRSALFSKEPQPSVIDSFRRKPFLSSGGKYLSIGGEGDRIAADRNPLSPSMPL